MNWKKLMVLTLNGFGDCNDEYALGMKATSHNKQI